MSEREALPLEPEPLGDHAAQVGPEADAAAGVQHAMPRHPVSPRTPLHGVPYRAGAARSAEERRDLPVAGHAAARDPAHQPVHGAVEGDQRAPPNWSS